MLISGVYKWIMDSEIARWTGSDTQTPEWYMLDGPAEEALLESYRRHIYSVERALSTLEWGLLLVGVLVWTTG